MGVKTAVGMKVKLVKGCQESVNPRDPSPITHGLWCAGRIPIGTVGTIFQIPQKPHEIYMKHPPRWAVDFGPEFPPKEGWHYGVQDEIGDSFEVVIESVATS